jgi:retron-type reverse transcriptase
VAGVGNKGAAGVDGMTVRQLPGILKARWPEIEHQLLQGRYQPQPVRRVQIPKPAGGQPHEALGNRVRMKTFNRSQGA